MIYFRNDDVNPSTDKKALLSLYWQLTRRFPDCVILSGINIFGRENTEGSVYPGVPFKNKPASWFYKVDSLSCDKICWSRWHETASHGLLHLNHANLSKDAQELSIVTSCEMLNTRKFIAPFNAYNEDTKNICSEYGIELVQESAPWLSLEHNKFDPNHKFWYFHSWRYTNERLLEELK